MKIKFKKMTNYFTGNIEEVNESVPVLQNPKTYRSIISERIRHFTDWLKPYVPKIFWKEVKEKSK